MEARFYYPCEMSLPQSYSDITKLQTATSYSDMQDLQVTGPAVQKTPIKLLPARVSGPYLHWLVLLSHRTQILIWSSIAIHPSPAQFMEKEGEISDQDTAMPEQELDQQLSDEQNY